MRGPEEAASALSPSKRPKDAAWEHNIRECSPPAVRRRPSGCSCSPSRRSPWRRERDLRPPFRGSNRTWQRRGAARSTRCASGRSNCPPTSWPGSTRRRSCGRRSTAAERTRCRLFGVDMDPLVVSRGLGKQINTLLVDLLPVAVAEVLADLRGRARELSRCFRIARIERPRGPFVAGSQFPRPECTNS